LNHHLNHELETIIKIIKSASNLIQDIRARGFEIKYKGDASDPVTEADLAASDFLMKEISRYFPNDLIVSEEAPLPEEVSEQKRIWFIDPIDGTKEFIKNGLEWSVMVGLAENNRPILGVVYWPMEDKLYYATKDQGAYVESKGNKSKLSVAPPQNPKEARIIQSRSHYDKKVDEIAKKLGITQMLKQGSIGLKLGSIAEGKADLYFNLSGKCHLWDLCGPEIILLEAQGALITESGLPISYHSKTSVIREKFIATSDVENTSHFMKLL
jgi:3'(2'), 5'-bisphosphate nucleotidase